MSAYNKNNNNNNLLINDRNTITRIENENIRRSNRSRRLFIPIGCENMLNNNDENDPDNLDENG